jgi:hypothetical protein
MSGIWKGVGGEGAQKNPSPPNLFVLAEKLGFNVDRFSKMMHVK